MIGAIRLGKLVTVGTRIVLAMCFTAWAATIDISASCPTPLSHVNDGDIVTGTNTSCDIHLGMDVTSNITLNNVNAGGITIGSSSNVTVTLIGSNTIGSGGGGNGSAQMTIDGTGSLDMSGTRCPTTINGGTVIFGNVSGIGGLTVEGGNVTITGNVNNTLTINGGAVTHNGSIGVDGSIIHNGGTLNGTPYFGTVPPTGLSDISTSIRLMYTFALLSLLLWGYVIHSHARAPSRASARSRKSRGV